MEISEKLRTLEAEKSNLLLEIEELKKQAEFKVTALEREVSMLREEVESFKTSLGLRDTISGDPPASKQEKAEKDRSIDP